MKPQPKLTRVLVVLFAAVLSFGLFACGGSSSSADHASGKHDEAFVGLWEVVTTTIDGETLGEDVYDGGREKGYYLIYLTLGADGSFLLDEYGTSEVKGTWESTDSVTATFTATTSTNVDEGAEAWTDPMTLKDGILTIGSDDFIITFKRMENDNRDTLTKIQMDQ